MQVQNLKLMKIKFSLKDLKKLSQLKILKHKHGPGVATDMQSQLMVLMCKANGQSSITRKYF